MADRNSNLAYDLSRYENYEERASQRRQDIKSRSTAVKPKPVIAAPMLVLLIIMAGAMLSFCITSKANIAAVHAAIVDEEATVRALEQENVSMVTRLEQKSSQKVVEDYAENVLGMQKLDNAQVEYISLESGNKVEIPEQDTSVLRKIKNAFDSFVEYLRG
ncbi:MAG: hypothetical protein SOZ56_03050 [Oscillospiraceae bacterium]|nr:hypothetical protein [Oscillospiraceae bacterium]